MVTPASHPNRKNADMAGLGREVAALCGCTLEGESDGTQALGGVSLQFKSHQNVPEYYGNARRRQCEASL